MKILVTGGAGFIASQIVDAYVADGHDVVIIDDLSHGKKKQVNPKARMHLMDARDPNISTLFAKEKFDVVNHHAAQVDVRSSVQDPFQDASVNILGTLRLLDCCRTYGVRKFIFASSGGTLYGECAGAPASESAPIRPESPYGYSKASAETYVQFYGHTYHLPYTILRYANVYGPRQDPEGEAGVVSIFIGKLLQNQSVTIYGDGAQERDYVSVADVVEANRLVLLKGENEIFNVGTGIPTSVNALYAQIVQSLPQAGKPTFAPKRVGELQRSVLDNSKIQKQLKWSPKISLADGLASTIAYFKDKPSR